MITRQNKDLFADYKFLLILRKLGKVEKQLYFAQAQFFNQ